MSGPVSGAIAPKKQMHRRSLRNYLLDSRFQLKYTGYFVGLALVLSLSLGALLWRVSRQVIAESQAAVQQAQETVRRGQDLVRESQKVSAVVRMNIIKDPVYALNPELAAVFTGSARDQDIRLAEQQMQLEADAEALARRAADLAHQRHAMLVVLTVILSLLVAGIGLAGIVLTHRVAGPVFKMQRLLLHVGEGHLKIQEKLRRHDELQEFFDAFETMLQGLRHRRENEIALLDEGISALEASLAHEQLEPLHRLRASMRNVLETSPPRGLPLSP